VAESTTTTQIIKEDPAIQTYKENLLKQVNDYIQDQIRTLNESGQFQRLPPDYQVAAQNQLQQKAAAMAQAGVGMYAPYLKRGSDLSQLGAEGVQTYGFGGLQDAFGATREGQSMLGQAAARANQYRNTPFAYQQRAANYLQGASGLGRDALGTGRSDIQSAIQQANRGQNVANQYLTGALDVGRGAMARGLGSLDVSMDRGYGSTQQAQQLLSGTGGQFDPRGVQEFMNPYEDEVVQRTLQDIRREGDIREQGLQAQAASAGAFGGSRQAVAEQELARNVLDQQGKAAGQLRQAGYGQASQQAQQAFEQAKQREQQLAQAYGSLGQSGAQLGLSGAQAGFGMGSQTAGLQQNIGAQLASNAMAGGQLGMSGAQLGGQLGMQAAGIEQGVGQQMGQLGLGYGGLEQQNVNQMMGMAGASGQFGQNLGTLAGMGGQLGQNLNQMGLQQAGLGQLVQDMYGRDLKQLEAFGGRDQAYDQAILDAYRMNQQQMYQMPYQQMGFLSDIYKGVPGSQQSITVQGQGSPSPFQQVAGLGIAGLSALGGAKTAGLF